METRCTGGDLIGLLVFGLVPADAGGTEGAAMSTDEAISYALANIDPKLLTGPVTCG